MPLRRAAALVLCAAMPMAHSIPSWGATTLISSHDGGPVREAASGISRNGQTAFAWTLDEGHVGNCTSDTGCRIQARTRTADGRLSPIVDVTPRSIPASSPIVVVADDGTAYIAWYRYDARPDPSASGAFDDPPRCCSRLQLRSLSPSGVLGPIRNLSSPDTSDTPENVTPGARIAVDPSGNVTLAWVRQEAYAHSSIRLRTMSASGDLGPLRNVSPVDRRRPPAS